jgi:hypothetical protein
LSRNKLNTETLRAGRFKKPTTRSACAGKRGAC